MSHKSRSSGPRKRVRRRGRLDYKRGVIVYGQAYGEFSYNGEPLQYGPLTGVWEPPQSGPDELFGHHLRGH